MHRLLPRVAAGLVLAGSLAACDLGGATTPRGFLTAAPIPVVLDLPDEGPAQEASATITVRNIGPATTAPLGLITSSTTSPGDQFQLGSPQSDCPNATLAFNETCTVDILVKGLELDGPYEVYVELHSDNTNTVRVPIYVR